MKMFVLRVKNTDNYYNGDKETPFGKLSEAKLYKKAGHAKAKARRQKDAGVIELLTLKVEVEGLVEELLPTEVETQETAVVA